MISFTYYQIQPPLCSQIPHLIVAIQQTYKGYEDRLAKLKGCRNRLQDHNHELEAQMDECFPGKEEEEGERNEEVEGQNVEVEV